MDLNRFRKLAGLNENWFNKQFNADDEDLTPAERKLAQKAEEDLKKKGINVDKDLSKAEERAEKLSAKKKAEKAAQKAAEPKKTEAKPEVKEEPKEKEEKDPTRSTKKLHQAMDWLKAHSAATRKEFMAHAETIGMSKAYAGAYFYLLKKRIANSSVKEAFILLHPSVARFALAENKQFNRFQWVSLEETAGLEPLVFDTKPQAEKVLTFINEYKSLTATVEKLSFDE